MWIRDSCGHKVNAVLDISELGIEVFTGKIWRADGRAREAEASCKFSREGWAKDVNVVGFGRVTFNCIADGGSKGWVEEVDVW